MATEINHLSTSESRKKKILLVITQSEMGGAQRFLNNLVSYLDKNRYQLRILVGIDGGGELVKKLTSQGVEVEIITSLKRNISPVSDFKALRALRAQIEAFKPEILFLNSSKAGFVGSLATIWPKRIHSVKVIYRIGGWTFNDPWSPFMKQVWIYLEKLSAPWKDIIIVNNEHDLVQAQELKIKPRENVALVYNGIDPYKLELLDKEKAREEIIKRLKGKTPKKIIGTIANIYPAKGLEYFISTAKYFSEADEIAFVIIGDGEGRQELEMIIKSEHLEDKVFLLGQLPDASQYLNAFDIFVLASLKEGFPWAVLEAMSARIPVICTPVGAIPEVIEDGKNGIIVPVRRPDLIALKIKEILQNEGLRKELVIQAHQSLLFKFSADKMVKEIEALL